MRFPRALLAVLREVLEPGGKGASLGRKRFAARRRGLEEKLDALIAEKREFSDPDNARPGKRLSPTASRGKGDCQIKC